MNDVHVKSLPSPNTNLSLGESDKLRKDEAILFVRCPLKAAAVRRSRSQLQDHPCKKKH